MEDAAEIIAEMMANNKAALYRCRHSEPDAKRVVPKLVQVLSCRNEKLVDEALRSLFLIGTPAVAAAPDVTPLISSRRTITKHLAIMALGQIAHKEPQLCVEPIASTLDDENCRKDALRFLAFVGSAAKQHLPEVTQLYQSTDAKTRKLVVVATAAIDGESEEALSLLNQARADRSKLVRDASEKALKRLSES